MALQVPSPFEFDKPQPGTPADATLLARLLAALAQTNLTVDVRYPLNPRDGMFRVNASNPSNITLEMRWQGNWVVVLQNIAGGGAVLSWTRHTFTALSVWTVTHNRGRHPLVQVLDASGVMLTPTTIQHVNNNQVVITHGAAYTGEVIVIG